MEFWFRRANDRSCSFVRKGSSFNPPMENFLGPSTFQRVGPPSASPYNLVHPLISRLLKSLDGPVIYLTKRRLIP